MISKKQKLSVSILTTVLLVFSSVSVAQNTEELLNFNVNETGAYQVTFEQLLDAGLDIDGEPIDNLALSNQGTSVSIQIKGSDADPQVFGLGAHIRFIAHELETIYTGTNVYTLSLDSTAQVLIDEKVTSLAQQAPFATSYLATKEYAPQTAYAFASPDENDPWYATRILALNQAASETVNIELDGYLPGGNTGATKASMKLNVWGGSDLPGFQNDHHVRVLFNGVQVIDETFDGFNKKEMNSELSNLQVGNNSIQLELPLDQGFDFEAVNLDKIEISYPRAFIAQNNVLNFISTSRKFRVTGFNDDQIFVYQELNGITSQLTGALSGGRCDSQRALCSIQFGASSVKPTYYFVVGQNDFKTPEFSFIPVERDIRSHNAEYLIITHPDFIASADETDLLGELSQSLADDFSSVDIVDVEQIYAQFGNHIFDPNAIREYIKFSQINRNTKVVLLVGGDVYDYRGYENQDATSFIPSIYSATGDLISFAPVDAKYVDLDDDDIPDLPIGRLPIRTMGELKLLLDKRNAYKNGNYHNQALFVADGIDDVEQYNFSLDAISVENEFFQNWTVNQAFTDELGVVGARQEIFEKINQGVSLTSFFGHSSTDQWTFDGLFNGFDAASLSNPDRPTVVTQWGCWNTYYVNPNEESMGHRFMMEGNRGAVSVMGAVTLTSAANERLLAHLLFERLTQGMPLGNAITEAKKEFVNVSPNSKDVVLGWTLLGFPELTLQTSGL